MGGLTAHLNSDSYPDLNSDGHSDLNPNPNRDRMSAGKWAWAGLWWRFMTT